MKKPSDVTKLVLKKSKKYIIFRIFVSVVYRTIAMIIPILLSTAINHATHGDYDNAISVAIISIIVVIIFRIFDILATYAWHKLYNCMYDNYTRIGVNKVFDNSIYSLSRFNIGEFLNMMSTDINVMADFYCNLIMRVIRIFEVLIIFVYFFMLDLYIGITGIIVAVISLSVIFLSSKTIEKLNQKKAVEFDNRNTIVNEFLLSIREIKTFNIFDTMKKRIDDSTQKYTKSFLRQRVGEDIFKFSVLAFIEFTRWLMVIYGVYLISIGRLEIGSLLIIYNYFAQVVDGFSEFTTINIGIRQLKVSQDRFYQLIIYSHAKQETNHKYNFKNFDIKFSGVLYGDRENPRLKDVTFDIKGNAINSIVGISGAGKSGVVDLLLKLNSQHYGTITIDDTEISDIDFEKYYKLVSSIDRNDRFLNVSIKENLDIIKKNFEHAVHICKKLGIHDEILKLKNGYDTIMNSSDDSLKADTKLLLNIVRILLKNTKVMIFDEVLSALTVESREKVLTILEEIKQDHTIIIIDRKKDILTKSDHIILLDEGHVENEGTHQDLLRHRPYKKVIEN